MNHAHREVLRKHRVFLVKELMVDILWPSLLEHDVFTNEMLEHIQATGARPSQVHRLLSDLTRRGPLAFDKFLLCLEDTDQSHIADKLRAAAEEVAAHEPLCSRSSSKIASCMQPVSKYTGSSTATSPLSIASSTPLSSFDCSSDGNDSLALTFTAARRSPLLDNRKLTDRDGGSRSSSESGSSSYGGSRQVNNGRVWQSSDRDDRRPDVQHSPAPEACSSRLSPQIRDTCGQSVATGSPPAGLLLRVEGSVSTVCGEAVASDGPPAANAVSHSHGLAEDGWSFTIVPSSGDPTNLPPPPPPSHDAASPNRRPLAGSVSLQPAGAASPARSTSLAPGSRTPTSAARTSRRTREEIVSLSDSARLPSDRVCTEHADGPADVDCSAAICSDVALGTIGKAVALPSKSLDIAGAATDLITPNWNKLYKMTSTPRGYCVIINNRHFSGHLRERIGTDVDCDNLYRLFSQLGYMISIKEDLTAMEMLVTLRDFALLDRHAAVDSCAVALLTHGLDGQVYGCDGRLIGLSEVFSFFDGHRCPALKGKPKIMFIQACRGEKYDVGFEATDSPGSLPVGVGCDGLLGLPPSDNSWAKKLPSCSDFLIAYATIPGHVSWRNSEEGSWFVKAFCEVFSRNAHHDDALSMLVEVNDRVATAYESATGHKQMPAPVVLLRKKLYFYPPIISPSALACR